MEVVFEASSVPDFAVVGEKAEEHAGQPFSEMVGVVTGRQHSIVDFRQELGSFEVEFGLVGDLVVGATVTGEPPEHFKVLAELVKVKAPLVLSDDVIPVEMPEVTGHQKARLRIRVERSEVVKELLHGSLQVLTR